MEERWGEERDGERERRERGREDSWEGREKGEGGEKENRGMKRKGFVFIFESRARGRKKKLNFHGDVGLYDAGGVFHDRRFF